jgi:hypothetical protein
MLNLDNTDKLKRIINSIEINFKRIDFALQRIKEFTPLEYDKLQELQPESISFIDQYIFRFAKAQDLIGDKLFRLLLQAVEEDIENVPFIDILNRLEKLLILSDKTDWIFLRKLRNEVSHEYPVIDKESTEALNNLLESSDKLKIIFNNCLIFLKNNRII